MYENTPWRRQTIVRTLTGTLLRAAGATAAFALVHSLLASEAAKRRAAKHIGPRSYRVAYNAQAIATTAALFLWLRRTSPDKSVYEISGPAAWVMRAGQTVALIRLIDCMRAVGVLNFLGLDPSRTIEAQGPASDRNGTLMVIGPFEQHRHPTNFWPVVLLWLQPRMSHAGLGFSIVASVYLYAGSHHQDARLRRAYGDAYERYRAAVPFFVPSLIRSNTSLYSAESRTSLNR
jgi:protein-S-isoprenylcysteine O-methyltransferase Ste14